MAEERHFVLRIEQPGAKARLADLAMDRYAVGRAQEVDGETVDFRIESDPAVSRLHFLLLKEKDGYALENRSANGTLVDGDLVQERTFLAPGAKIQIGEKVSITFHVWSTADRAREFGALAATGEKKPRGATKSFFKRPLFLGLVAFYVVVILLAIILATQEDPPSIDPGPGPEYFGWMMTRPLGSAEGVTEGRREAAERMWRETLEEYGGDLAGVGGNDYQVLLRARRVLHALGYRKVGEALAAGENVASELRDRKHALELQLSAWYQQAKEDLWRGRYSEAQADLERIKLAVPNSMEPLHRFAVQRLQWLDEKRGR